jgi:hypothetical protein
MQYYLHLHEGTIQSVITAEHHYRISSKNSAWKYYYCLCFAEFLEVNIAHSIRVRILFPYIAYTHGDLCRKIRDYFRSFGKGCRIIRRADFLEVR